MQSSVFRNRFPFERTTPPKVYSTIVVMDVRDATWRSTSVTSLMIFDLNSKVLLATGSWKDSALHGFRNSENVVDGVVEQTLGEVEGTVQSVHSEFLPSQEF
jgi:hypothetical protein